MKPNLISAGIYRCAQLLFNKPQLLPVVFLLIISSLKVSAQDFFPEEKDYAITAGTGFELPGKNLSNYNGAASALISFTRLVNERFSVGINMSYREFNPKTTYVVNQIDAGHQQTLTYSNYSTFLFYLDGAYAVPFTERVNIYGGLNLGMGYNTSSVLYHDDSGDTYVGGSNKQIYAAPKLGLSYSINSSVGLDLHAAYNLFAQGASSGTTVKNAAAPSSSFSSIMTNVGVVFKF